MTEKRVTGNRRSEQELIKYAEENNKAAYELQADQSGFLGTPEQLEMMQNLERAYLDGKQLVSDEEFDIYKRKWNYKESLIAKAPSGRDWVRMQAPLGSLDKVGSFDELKSWIGKQDQTEFTAEVKLDGLTANLVYELSEDKKFYNLKYISSRGNGRSGLVLHPFALYGVKSNYPEVISSNNIFELLNSISEERQDEHMGQLTKIDDLPETIELRGEAVVPKTEKTIKRYGKDSVWRNIAAGIFNRKTPANSDGIMQMFEEGELTELEMMRSLFSLTDSDKKWRSVEKVSLDADGNIQVDYKDETQEVFPTSEEFLDIVFYSMSYYGSNLDSIKIKNIPGVKYVDSVKSMDGYDFKSFIRTNDVNELIQFVSDFYGTDLDGNRIQEKDRARNLYEYAMDGVVIKPLNSDSSTQHMDSIIGRNGKYVTPHYPSDQIAIKLQSEIVRVKIDHFEYRETSLGNKTISGILDKPYLTESGAMVSTINLHNPIWLEQNNWIKEGGEYDMVMSLDIIPVLLNPSLM